MAIGSLVVRLGLDSAEFTAGLTKSQQQLQKFVEGAAVNVANVAKVLGTVVTVGTATIAVFRQLNESISSWQGNAEQIGTTAKAFSELQLASRMSGQSMEYVASSSSKLSLLLTKSGASAEIVAEALGAIGLSVADFKQLDPVAQLEEVAKAMYKFEDGAGKTAVAMTLFGRDGQKMISFTKDLAEQGLVSTGITQEQIDASDRLSKAFSRLQFDIESLAQGFAAKLIPVFQEFLDTINAVQKSNFFGWLVTSGKETADPIKRLEELSKSIATVKKEISTLESMGEGGGFLSGVKKIFNADDLAAYRAQLKAMEKQQAYLREVVGNRITGEGGVGPPAPKKPTIDYQAPDSSSKSSSSKSPKITEAERYQQMLEKQLESTLKLSEYETLYAEISAGRLKGLTAGEEAALASAAKAIDYAKERIELSSQQEAMDKLIGDAQQRAAEADRKANEELKKTAETFLDAADPMRVFIRNLELIQKLLDKGFISPEQAKMIRASLGEIEKPLEEMSAFADQAARNIQSAFADFLFDPFKDGMDDMLKNFLKIIQRMIAEAAAAAILKAIFGAGDEGKGNGLSGALGKIFGLASGGPVQANTPYIVGEKGPELFMPRGAGTIVPNNALGGSQMVFTQSISVGEGANSAMILSAIDAANKRTKADIASAYRRGQGAFA